MSISLVPASDPTPAFLNAGGEMGARIRAFDWGAHPLGPPRHWPQALQTALGLCLNSSFPTAIYWGEDMHLLYNDAWSTIPAEKHPWALGRTAAAVWPDIWHIVGGQLRQVLATGEGIALYDQLLPMERGGQPRETWWNYSLTAIRHADGSIGGVFNQGNDTTELVQARRRRQLEVERWRGLFRQSPAPAALLRGASHVFEFVNPAYLEMVGQRDIRVATTGAPEEVHRAVQAASGGQRVQKVMDVILPGGLRRFDLSLRPVFNARREVIGIVPEAIDITDRA